MIITMIGFLWEVYNSNHFNVDLAREDSGVYHSCIPGQETGFWYLWLKIKIEPTDGQNCKKFKVTLIDLPFFEMGIFLKNKVVEI